MKVGELAVTSNKSARHVVGIHIRYGMAKAKGFGGCIPTALYYQKAIEYFR
jgi:hypothetical protein